MWLLTLIACGSPGELRWYGLGVADVDLRFTDPTYDTRFEAPGYPPETLTELAGDVSDPLANAVARGEYGGVVDAMDDCGGPRAVGGAPHLGHLNVAWPIAGTALSSVPSTCDPSTLDVLSVSLLWNRDAPDDPTTTAWLRAGVYLEGATPTFDAITIEDERTGRAVVSFVLSDAHFCDMPVLDGTLEVSWAMTSAPAAYPFGC